MVGTIRYNNGVRSNSVTPAVAGVEQERAILRCMSVGTVGLARAYDGTIGYQGRFMDQIFLPFWDISLGLSSQLVPKSTRTLVNSYLFWSTRTRSLVNSYLPESTRTYFGQLVPFIKD